MGRKCPTNTQRAAEQKDRRFDMTTNYFWVNLTYYDLTVVFKAYGVKYYDCMRQWEPTCITHLLPTDYSICITERILWIYQI